MSILTLFSALIFLNTSNLNFGLDQLVYLLVILILLLFSMMMSASEAAFFSLGPNESNALKTEDSKSSKTILQLLEKPRDLLATILITNNLVNVGVIIVSSYLMNSFYPSSLSSLSKILIDVLGITLFILIFGEVIPKIYATRNVLKTVRITSTFLFILNKIPPISWFRFLLVGGTSVFNNLLKKKKVKTSSDEIEQALALTKEDSSTDEEQKILESIVKFGNTEVSQIMKSRIEISALDEKTDFQQVLTHIKEFGYSRIPIFEESLDKIKGILHIKDLLPYLSSSSVFNWKQFIRKPLFVPENKKIDDLLKEFQVMKMHMSIVVDEYGGVSGLITLEDILEEIVGDITDEFDDAEIVYTRIDSDTFLFEGRTSLIDFCKIFEIDLKEIDDAKGEADTIGGLIIEQAGRILKNNEYVVCGPVKFTVESSDKRRIKMVKASRLKNENE